VPLGEGVSFELERERRHP